jgi:AcrR family transcriptional regulator
MTNAFGDTPRGRILAAAATLFRNNGFERTTVRDLATAVGIQSGSIFHHFRTKEEILREVMIEAIRFNTDRMVTALAQASSPQDRVLALIQSELQSINGETGEAMAVLFYEWRSLSDASQREILVLRERYERLWLECLKEAQDAGLINSGVDTFILRRFLTGAFSWSNFWFDPDGPLDIEGLALQGLRMVTQTMNPS